MKRGVLFIMLIFSLLSCDKDNNDNLDKELHVRDFIWKGLNHWYLWQKDVPDLADSRFAVSVAQTNVDNTAYVNFLKSYDSPKKLFVNLLNQYQKIDRFSFITEDYTELERSFQGISLSSGMNFVLSRYGSGEGVLGVVRYVLPNSSAELQGVKRGDIFVAIDGTPLNINNYTKLLFNPSSTMRMDMARAERINDKINIVETGVSVTVTKSEITENPIFIHKVITKGEHKIGYLMYNSFVANFDKALNEAFGEFKNQGVTDLVLDLRYNGGGRISSAVYLASMITGQFGGQLFAKERWNDKLQPIIDKSGASLYFADKIGATPINSLNLSKVHIITTNRTASASELVINGLKAYVDVVQIGETTLGKNEGSITVYDSRSGIDKQGINPKHKWAMQPLVLKIENARGEGDYTSGLVPSITIAEDVTNFGVLGEESEPLLAKAIQNITGFSGKSLPTQVVMPVQYLADSKSFNLAENQMYK
ncbi:S41 family peptidase [Capnocytophaga sp.]|uniref:S41 family peptidase n=1 Tax=Capnocytophaga sp. TaxID=44737 RepID=UPI0026DDB6CF|nr:S41 family peptidase [Capnocytophaga sp.]MDO5105290.1 S41 family peptidase [Capnocytophaga sp.]